MKYRYLSFLIFASCTSVPDSSVQLFDTSSSTPVLVGQGVISTAEYHEAISYLDEENRALFFTRSDQQFDSSNIYVSYYEQGKWGSPLKLPFSDSGYDAGFSLSPGGDLAFFTSKRAPKVHGLSEEWNIWKVSVNENDDWGEPEVLEAPLNSEGLECCLTMNRKGLTFFSSNRAGSWDIYTAQFEDGQFKNIRLVEGLINSDEGEWPAFVNKAGDLLLLSSIRKSGIGGDDIYFSRKVGDSWSEPELMEGPINTTSYEDSPILTSDNKFLLYSSWRDNVTSNGRSNIYSIPFKGKD